MTLETLRAITDAEMRQSVGYWTGTMANMRQKAMYYYLAEAKGDLAAPEVEGRSSVIAPVVRNTIESMLPQLEVKFSGSDNPVEFAPRKPGDEQAAEQATDYINYLYNVSNHGRRISHIWMKDALLSKVGILKVWWDTRHEETREEYRGLNQVELAQILDDEEVEVIEQSSYPDEEDAEQRRQAIQHLTQQAQQAQQAAQQGDQQAIQALQQMQQQIAAIQAQPPAMLYDIACKRVDKGGRLRIENVPPEEFMIARNAKDIETAPFVGHRVVRTRSELESMGYKNIETSSGDDAAAALNVERVERLSWDDEMAYVQQTAESMDESQRLLWVTECYLRVDFDGDGIAELRKVLKVGSQILENEVVDVAPFVSICPVPLPHKFFGLSIADLAMEAQRTETSILRGVLDNQYLQVDGRYFAVEGQVNIDDLLVTRPGGVVRVKSPGMVGRLDQGMGDLQSGMQMLEYMKGFNEDSTGWTRYNQGQDGDSLNHTATGTTILTNRADMRLDLIARNFGDGFRDLFRMMLKLVCQFQQKEDVIKLRGDWVPIDPREWRNGFECVINVGIGTGNKDQAVSHLMALLQQQQQGLMIGTATPENVYQAQNELAKSMGFRNGDKFFSDPAKMPPRPSPPSPEQIKSQTQLQIAQMQLQDAQQERALKHQQEMARIQAEAQAKLQDRQADLQVQASNDERDSLREQARAQMDAQQKAMEARHKEELEAARLAFDRYRADLDAQVKLTIADKSAAPPVDVSPIQAQLEELMAHINAPAQIVRDEAGRAVGIVKGSMTRKLVRGPDGRAVGIQ